MGWEARDSRGDKQGAAKGWAARHRTVAVEAGVDHTTCVLREGINTNCLPLLQPALKRLQALGG